MPAVKEYGLGRRSEKRRRRLAGERDQADLSEIEMERAFQQWIDRRNQRLHHVVQEMAEADGRQNAKGRIRPHTLRSFRRDCTHVSFHDVLDGFTRPQASPAWFLRHNKQL
jgi:hypothetical protein